MPRMPGTRQNKQQTAMRALAAVREIGAALNYLANQVNMLAASLVGIETLLEVTGILTPEAMEKARPLIKAKLAPPKDEGVSVGQTQEVQTDTAPAVAPESTETPLDNEWTPGPAASGAVDDGQSESKGL